MVQGVGYRPFVYNLALSYGLAGHVGNDPLGVFIDAEGPAQLISRFTEELSSRAPPLAVVESVQTHLATPSGSTGFAIIGSETSGPREALVPADMAPCAHCVAEMLDPAGRRYRYAFTNCTNCGPRFTITKGVPYDRWSTTMAGFEMCPACRREYEDPRDRRFHAQPICCPSCGPRLRLTRGGTDFRSDVSNHAGRDVRTDPIQAAAKLISRGSIVAVKGVGGFHLAVDALDDDALVRLRRLKQREERPFAILVPDTAAAERLVRLSEEARRILEGPERPIVLAPRFEHADVGNEVAPANRWLGVMLPPSPLHHLLALDVGRPFVLTSGNISDEPICYEDEDARVRLGPIADAFLTHDRPIAVRADDSVLRVAESTTALRRSRGYTPRPIRVPIVFTEPVLAVGAELKSTFCFGKGGRVVMSQHIGDLENYETYRSFVEGIEHFSRMLGVEPRVVAHDLHPEYLSTKHARDLEERGAELVGVQHHHAHIVSCMTDNGFTGPVIGLALDGLGYGTDGTIWGGEILAARCDGFERIGRLRPVPMPGGTKAIRNPWRMAASYLEVIGASDLDLHVTRDHHDFEDVLALARSGVASPLTSSAGRLFDAVAAVIGLRDTITYEGQAAVELEQLADPEETSFYRAPISEVGGLMELDGSGFFADALEDHRAGVPGPAIAGRFHNGLARLFAEAAELACERTGIRAVALSGGVFQNALFLTQAVRQLRTKGLEVLTHSRVPPNDGGVSLGQAVVAGCSTDPR